MVLFPGCRCCTPCGCDAGTKLPYTTTVTFSDLVNKTHGPHAALTFSAPFGSGAAGVLMSPGGCDDNEKVTCGPSNRGPITAVLLTSGGSGYAQRARVAPDLTITASPGEGCTFTPTLAKDDSNDCPVWSLDSIDVSGGTGYVDYSKLTITIGYSGDCCTTITKPAAVLRTKSGRIEPTVTVSAGSPGSGAVLEPVLTSNGDSPETWGVASVTVTSGGSGYLDYEVSLTPSTVTFSTPDTEVSAAAGNVRTHISEPTTFQMFDLGGGTGAFITPTLSAITVNGRIAWEATGTTITTPGSGYTVGDQIEVGWPEFYALPEQSGTTYPAVVDVTSVDGGGGVTGVTISQAGVFRVYDDSIESIGMTKGGKYYGFGDTGIPTSVEVTTPGKFYCVDPDPAAEPCVANVKVTANGGGTGAVITPTIGVDPTKADEFGRILSLKIDDPGKNYLAWHWECTADKSLNGLDFVLRAHDPKPLVVLSIESCYGCGATAVVDNSMEPGEDDCAREWDGSPSPIHSVTLANKGSGYAVLGRQEPSSLSLSVGPDRPGSGATFTPTWTEDADECGRPIWKIDSIATKGGTGYINGEPLWFKASLEPPLFCIAPASATLNVPENSTVPSSVTVHAAGKYYEENDLLPALVADVTVNVIQYDGSSGSGADIQATVNNTVGDPDFGKVTELTVVSGGTDYSLFGGPKDCRYVGGCAIGGCAEYCSAPGATGVALSAVGGEPLEVTLFRCGVAYPGTVSPGTHFRSSENVADCGSLPTSATLWYGGDAGSVTIAPNGTWDFHGTQGCGAPCVCPSVEDLCITFTITDYNGTVHVPTISYEGNSAYVSVTILNELGGLAMYYNAIVQCQDGKLVLGGSGAVYVNSNCPTGATGDALCLGCDCECPENWWLADETFELHYDCTELDCSECDHVDDVLGTIRIEISNPPC